MGTGRADIRDRSLPSKKLILPFREFSVGDPDQNVQRRMEMAFGVDSARLLFQSGDENQTQPGSVHNYLASGQERLLLNPPELGDAGGARNAIVFMTGRTDSNGSVLDLQADRINLYATDIVIDGDITHNTGTAPWT